MSVVSSSDLGPSTSGSRIPSPNPIYISEDDEVSPIPSPQKQSFVAGMFPQLSPQQSTLLFELCNGDVHEVVQLLLEDLPLPSILSKLANLRLVCLPRSNKIHPDRIVEDGLRCYKGSASLSSPLEIELVGTSAIDLGGVRRQFFTCFLRKMPLKLKLFEFNGSVAFPAVHTDALVGGHYACLGRIIVHSVLQEGLGFPCLPRSIYYYFVGGIDLAIVHLSIDELPAGVDCVVKEVCDTQDMGFMVVSVSDTSCKLIYYCHADTVCHDRRETV